VPEKALFLETYLREIGVHTPVSLLSFGPEKTSEYVQPDAQQNDAAPDVEIDSANFKTLDALCEDASSCRLCALADTRTQVVFGAGNPHADLLFVGEAPGQDEDLQGEPFVGRSGQLLDRMLHAIGMDRDNVYMMNSIKCRPPNNRDPRPDEVQACKLWFEQQLDIIQPKMICLLGRVAAQTVLKTDDTLGALRGSWHEFQGIPVWVTYHPAYLLRSPRQKQKSWQDMMQLKLRFQALKISE